MHAEELSNITSSHRTQMLEFEAKQRSKSEKAIRESREEAEREMKKTREKLASESELMRSPSPVTPFHERRGKKYKMCLTHYLKDCIKCEKHSF